MNNHTSIYYFLKSELIFKFSFSGPTHTSSLSSLSIYIHQQILPISLINSPSKNKTLGGLDHRSTSILMAMYFIWLHLCVFHVNFGESRKTWQGLMNQGLIKETEFKLLLDKQNQRKLGKGWKKLWEQRHHFPQRLPSSDSYCLHLPWIFQRTREGYHPHHHPHHSQWVRPIPSHWARRHQLEDPGPGNELSSLATCTQLFQIKWITYCWWIPSEYPIDSTKELICTSCHTTGVKRILFVYDPSWHSPWNVMVK